METIGRGMVPDHTPDCAGFPGLELEKVTDTGLAFPTLLAKSEAVTEMVWTPFANFAVLKEKVYGLVISAVPIGIPSSWTTTPATPLSASDAVTFTVAVPVSTAPDVGAVMLTAGGVVSCGGL